MKFLCFALTLLLLTSFTPFQEVPPIAFVARNPAHDGIISGIAPSGRTVKVGGKLFVRERNFHPTRFFTRKRNAAKHLDFTSRIRSAHFTKNF